MSYVVTGQAVVLDRRVAHVFPRILAGLIDAITYILLSFGILVLILYYFGNQFDTAGLQWLALVVIIMLMALLPGGTEWATKGRSLGKLIVGTRVVRDDGGAIGFRHVMVRVLVGVLELWSTSGGLAIIFALSTKDSKRLGDMVAGTYVMITRAPKIPPALPKVPEYLSQWAQLADIGRIPSGTANYIAEFLRTSRHPALAATLAHQIAGYVRPTPPAQTNPVDFLIAVMALRRDKDVATLQHRVARRQQLAQRLNQ